MRHAELADEQERGGRHDRPRDVAQDPVDAAAQLRTREREPPGVLGELRAAYASAPTAVACIRPDPAATNEPDSTRSPAALTTGSGSPVSSDSSISSRSLDEHDAVDHDLVARRELEHVVEHDRGGREPRRLAVAHDRGGRRGQQREPVEGPLRAELLHDPDHRVRDEHDAEQRVLHRSHEQDQNEHRAEQRVEPGEDVRADDVRDGASGGRRRPIDLPTRDAIGDLVGAEAAHGIHRRSPGRVHLQSLRCTPCRPGWWPLSLS